MNTTGVGVLGKDDSGIGRNPDQVRSKQRGRQVPSNSFSSGRPEAPQPEQGEKQKRQRLLDSEGLQGAAKTQNGHRGQVFRTATQQQQPRITECGSSPESWLIPRVVAHPQGSWLIPRVVAHPQGRGSSRSWIHPRAWEQSPTGPRLMPCGHGDQGATGTNTYLKSLARPCAAS